MKTFTTLFLLLFFSFFGNAQDCNLLFEDFESFTPNTGNCLGPSIVSQSNGDWIKYSDNARQGCIYNVGGEGNSLDIRADQFEPQIIQVLDTEPLDSLTLRFGFYNECGGLVVDFLESFTNANDLVKLTGITLEYDLLTVGNETFPICYSQSNAFNSIELILDFSANQLTLACTEGSAITVDFLTPGDRVFGIAYGSNQCNFIDNICVNIVPSPVPPASFSFLTDTIFQEIILSEASQLPLDIYHEVEILNNSLDQDLELRWNFISHDLPIEWGSMCNTNGIFCDEDFEQDIFIPANFTEFLSYHLMVMDINNTGGTATTEIVIYDPLDSLNTSKILTFITNVELGNSGPSFLINPEEASTEFIIAEEGQPLFAHHPIRDFVNNRFNDVTVNWTILENTWPAEWFMEYDLIIADQGFTTIVPTTGSITLAINQPFYPLEFFLHTIVPNGIGGQHLLSINFYDPLDSLNSNTTIDYITTICPQTTEAELIEGITDSIYCSGAEIILTAIGEFDNYLWSNGNTDQQITTTVDEITYITASNEIGCTLSDTLDITISRPIMKEICLVTIDSATGYNQINFERDYDTNTASYNIYKETTQADVFDLIGSLPFTAPTLSFIDENSNPLQNSNRYKIAVVDSCGNESSLSNQHQTIHLVSNVGINGETNLLWNAYVGFEYGTFNILRGTSNDDLQLIAQQPANLFSFSDLAPPSGNDLYYQIEVIKADACDPTRSSEILSTRSNLAIINTTSVTTTFAAIGLHLFPNPVKDHFMLTSDLQEGAQIILTDMLGREIKTIYVSQVEQNKIEVGTLNSGLYNLKIVLDSGKIAVKKIIVH